MPLATPPVAPLYSGHLVFAPDGQVLAVGLADGRAQLLRVCDGAVVRTLQAPPGRPGEEIKDGEPTDFSRDGSLVMARAWPYWAVVWRVADGSVRGAFRHASAGYFTPDGQQVVAQSQIWRLADGVPLYQLSCAGSGGGGPGDLVFAPDARWVARTDDGQVCIWRLP